MVRLRGSIRIEHTLARLGAERSVELLHSEPYVPALGALTGNQALQQVRAGLKAIYVSGWQVAGDANLAGQMYPDQSLYPANSVPALVRAINNALPARRPDPAVGWQEGLYWFAPIVADAEAGFGGTLNAFELMKAMIEAGAAAVHFEDQLASAKKCGHLGGKVWCPLATRTEAVGGAAGRRCLGVPTVLDGPNRRQQRDLLLSDADPETSRSSRASGPGRILPVSRRTSRPRSPRTVVCSLCRRALVRDIEPNLDEARRFAEAIHDQYPGKLLAYNCSPSFHWKAKLDDATIARFQARTGRHGLRIPVRHAGRFPCPEPQHVRTGA